MDFICFLHTFSRLHNCIDFDLYVHAFRCHGRAKINVFITVLQLILFKFRRIQKPSQESLGNTRVSIDRLWSFLWHISACHSKCWFNGVGGGGEEHYLTYLDLKSNQSISTFINWHGADLLCNLDNLRCCSNWHWKNSRASCASKNQRLCSNITGEISRASCAY